MAGIHETASKSATAWGTYLSEKGQTITGDLAIVIPENYEPDLIRPGRSADPSKFEIIGYGAQGIVLSAVIKGGSFASDQNGNDEIRVACKRFDSERLSRLFGNSWLLKETQITKFCIHDNIVRYIDSFWEPSADGSRWRHFWMVTERMDCSLKHWFRLRLEKAKGDLKETVDHRHLGSVMVQVLWALDFLHDRGIMHRDLNSKNIGYRLDEDMRFTIKLFDFGTAGFEDRDQEHSIDVGTPSSCKPLEVIQCARYSSKVDIWSAALVALEMLGCYLMGPKLGKEQIRRLDLDSLVRERILDVLGLPADKYKKIFSTTLQGSQCRPAKWDQEIQAAFVNLKEERKQMTGDNLKQLLGAMLHIDPNERLTAEECLKQPYLSDMATKLKELKQKRIADPSRAFNQQLLRNQRDGELFNELLRSSTKMLRPPGA